MSEPTIFDRGHVMSQRAHGGRRFATKSHSGREWLKFVPPRWYVRWRLDLVTRAIADVERRLADEFGTLDTAPLHHEHKALLDERLRLLARLAGYP